MACNVLITGGAGFIGSHLESRQIAVDQVPRAHAELSARGLTV